MSEHVASFTENKQPAEGFYVPYVNVYLLPSGEYQITVRDGTGESRSINMTKSEYTDFLDQMVRCSDA